MKIKGNTVLITGGASGIGFSIAEALINAGNNVLICGRRASKLKEAQDKLPQLQIRVCDISREEERKSLFNWVKDKFPECNILINNAGVLRAINFAKGINELLSGEDEIETNLVAPIHLSAYFIPSFLKQKEAAIVNITTGLAFVPIATMPVYCAAKAAIHSFSLSLRHQLKDSPVKVFEIVPPLVETEAAIKPDETPGLELKGIPASEVARATLTALANNEYEVLIGENKDLVRQSRMDPEKAFQNLNRWW